MIPKIPLLLANGRECAVVDMQYDAHQNSVSAGSPRNGIVTFASPILAAASSWPFLTLLTSDGGCPGKEGNNTLFLKTNFAKLIALLMLA